MSSFTVDSVSAIRLLWVSLLLVGSFPKQTGLAYTFRSDFMSSFIQHDSSGELLTNVLHWERF